MSELAFRDGIMDRIRLKERRYDERAYAQLVPGETIPEPARPDVVPAQQGPAARL